MKRICLFFFVIAFAPTMKAQMNYGLDLGPKEVQAAYAGYMSAFPQSTLQDFYKLCFQDVFGPGHIISDAKSAEAYLMSEIASTQTFGGPIYEPCGIRGRYVRVNISLVADSVLPAELLLEAFVESAVATPLWVVTEWPEAWGRILESLPSSLRDEPASQDFLKSLEEVFAKGEFAFHHSRRFNAAYSFHYRIVDRNIFEQKLLPLINKHYFPFLNE